MSWKCKLCQIGTQDPGNLPAGVTYVPLEQASCAEETGPVEVLRKMKT